MKDYGRKIKISDLLRNPGKEDTIVFEKKHLHELEDITSDGVKGEAVIVALDSYSLLLSIYDLEADIGDISDLSGESYTRHVHNPLYEALFLIPHTDHKHAKSLDESIEHFQISEKDESIDIEECVTNALVAMEPVVKMTDEESLSNSKENVENDMDQYV